MLRQLGNISRRSTPRFFTTKTTPHISYIPQLRTIIEKNPAGFLQTNETCWYSATQLLLNAKNNHFTPPTIKPNGPIVMGEAWNNYLNQHGFKVLKLPDCPEELASQLKEYGPLVFVTNPRNESPMLHIVNVARVSENKVTLIDNKLMESNKIDDYITEIPFAKFLDLAKQDNVISAEEYFSIPNGLRPPIFNDKGELVKHKDLPREGTITIRQLTAQPLYYLEDLVTKLNLDLSQPSKTGIGTLHT